MEQSQLALESYGFELAYERTCRQVEVLYDAERSRQLRVHALVLEADKENYQSQLIQADNRIDGLKRFNERLREDLEVYADKLESAQGQLRFKSREVETIKAELNSLHGVTMDSTRLLTEKLTLARELSALRPEIDHLRSQAASHHSLLADKLSLQRQLSTVQVELTTEKRATQRALAKEKKLQAEDAKFDSRLEVLQADLVKERRERQTVERKAQKDSTESENKITMLESRLDAFRNKLKSTKEQLKEAQTSLQAAQLSNHSKFSRASASMNPIPSVMDNPRKRGAAQMDVDSILGTPGDLPAVKQSKRGSSLIGEKSTFSITPFLNRTASVAPESPRQNNASVADKIGKEESDQLFRSTCQNAASTKAIPDLVDMSDTLTDTVQANKPGMLRNAKTVTINSKAPRGRKTKAAASLEQVAEEDIENAGSDPNVSEPAAIKIPSNDTFHGSFEIKRRKRKLLRGGLGKTLFDEDDGDALKDGLGLVLGVRGLGALENRRPRVPDMRVCKATGPNMSNFGAISPLKKDRRVPCTG